MDEVRPIQRRNGDGKGLTQDSPNVAFTHSQNLCCLIH